ncbi:MAG: PQQ-binding-like beta-propeller repeat protein, partial [Phycisphaerae bacterium]|nr:PQQ-binding-like beta-propeller repeat protein [Phycisphaerae bacterium]
AWTKKLDAGKWPDSLIRNDWPLRVPSGHLVSGPTLAGGRMFVSLTELGVVVAMDEKDGRALWSYATGGRLDTPPTLTGDACLVGSHDGWVYTLDAASGKLAWRFRAAPASRRIVAFGQMESSWPVIGGVLADGGLAYAVAGRNTETDGGVFVHALDPASGKAAWSSHRPSFAAANQAYLGDRPGYGMADLLASDGTSIAIGGRASGQFGPKTGEVIRKWPWKFNVPVAVGFNYVSRNLYGYGPGEYPPCPVAFTDAFSCGPAVRFKSEKEKVRITAIVARPVPAKTPAGNLWDVPLDVVAVAESIVIAGDKVLVAVSRTADGKRSGELLILRAGDGSKAGSVDLPAPPVFEGIAVGADRVFVSLEDGTIACLGAGR